MAIGTGHRSVLRVSRSKEEAKKSYDRISRFYDFFAGPIERKYRDMALECMNVKEGEKVLEIGFGTGHCIKQIAKKVGKAYGMDISSGMLRETEKRLEEQLMRMVIISQERSKVNLILRRMLMR